MPALAIIKYLDIFKDTLPCLLSGFVILVVDKLVLECTKKAFSNRIIQAFSLATHAAAKFAFLQLLLISTRGIGAALIGVHDDIVWSASSPNGHGQRVLD